MSLQYYHLKPSVVRKMMIKDNLWSLKRYQRLSDFSRGWFRYLQVGSPSAFHYEIQAFGEINHTPNGCHFQPLGVCAVVKDQIWHLQDHAHDTVLVYVMSGWQAQCFHILSALCVYCEISCKLINALVKPLDN